MQCHVDTQGMRPNDLGSHAVVNETQLLEFVRSARSKGERIVMTNGCFDILHAGHVQYLAEAAKLGDRLIVAVNSDESVQRLKGETRPVNPLNQRMVVLAGLASVDWVGAFDGSSVNDKYEDTPRDIICKVKPDVLVKGGDYLPEQVAGAECSSEVVILGFKDGCSTSQVIHKIQTSGVVK